jgi:hypothetical protein
MDFFTIVIILSVVVGVGVIGYALFFGKKEEEEVGIDAEDVTLLSAGMQNPMLGVAAYTAGKAAQKRERVGCCGDDCSCGTDIDIADDFATAMITSTTDDPPSDSEFIVEEPEPPVARSHTEEVFHHVDLGKTEEPSPTVEESRPPREDTPAKDSGFSHAEYEKSDSPSESVSTISEPPSSSSSNSNNDSGNSGD